MKFFTALLCLSQVAQGFQLDQKLIHREGVFEIAHNELQVRPTDGSVARSIKIKDQKSAAQTLNYAQYLDAQSGERYNLVLYEVGKKPTSRTRRVLTRSILVTLAPGADGDAIARHVSASDFQIPDYSANHLILNFTNAEDSLAKLSLLNGYPGVTTAEPLLAKRRFKRFTPNDPRYGYSNTNTRYQWHLKNTGQNNGVAGIDANVESAWDQVKGAGIIIGIVDDGLEVAHPDLAPNANTAIDHDWNDDTPDDPSPTSSFDNHGTACAGVAAAKGDNSEGGSGAAPDATLVGLRLIAGSVSDADEAEAMSWRSDVIQIKSNSWGPADGGGVLEDDGPLVQAAFQSSTTNGRGGLGTIYTWAAGNGGSNDNVNQDGYANSIYTIAVGAVNDKGERSSYSEPGCAKLISAPSDGDGGDQAITTTTLTQSGDYTDRFGGTSSATPLISGVIALMLEKNPNLGWRDVQEILIQSAVKVSPRDFGWFENGVGQHFNHEFGAGNVDALVAVDLSANWENLEEQESQTLTNSTINQAIPENSTTGISTTFDFSGNETLRVEHVTLTAKITHPNRGQLTLTLISPSGTESLLSVPHDRAGADFNDWKMMTVFNWGEDSAGVWTFKVTDTETGQTGTLNNASMTIFGSSNGPVIEEPKFTHDTSISGNVDSDFSFSVRAQNSAISYTASGLPNGLEIDQANGLIEGIPTMEGSFTVSLTSTNEIGTTNGSILIDINPRIPSPPVVTGREDSFLFVDQFFEYQLMATNSPSSYSASILPSGLSFNTATGLLSGTPAVLGDYSVILSAANADGSDSLVLSLTVVEQGSGPIAQALDNGGFYFYDEAGAVWISQQVTFSFGEDAMQSPNLGNNEEAAFSAEVTGPGFLSFQWKVSSEEGYDYLSVALDGEDENSISGEIDWSEGVIAVPAGAHVVSWIYRKDGSASFGDDLAWVDQVMFSPGPVFTSLGDALDYPGLDWRPDGSWRGQTLITHDGEDALQSPNISDDGDTELSLELTGPGQLSFFYRCDSEEDYDFFICSLDGSEEFEASGLVEWTQHTITIPAGTHTVSWEYQKDGSVSSGADSVWLDQMVWQTSTLSGYQQWANQRFTLGEQTDPEFGQEQSDPDGDGRANLLEYALNTSPFENGVENEPTVFTPGTVVALTYLADTEKIDIRYEIQESTDLENWTNIPQTVLSMENGIETRRALKKRTGEVLFLRMVVSKIP